jgi:hypothetical protein
LTSKKEPQQVGGYDVYKLEVPAYVTGFRIEGYDSSYTQNNGVNSTPEIKDIIDEDHQANTTCHFCGSEYHFSEEELNNLYNDAKKAGK